MKYIATAFLLGSTLSLCASVAYNSPSILARAQVLALIGIGLAILALAQGGEA